MTKFSIYAFLAISALTSVASVNADPYRRNVVLVDNTPEDLYDREDRYRRESRIGREEFYEREERREYRDRYDYLDRYPERTRTVYIIIDNRPVRRVVHVDPRGECYRIIDGRRVVVRERYFTSYPSRYFYSDGQRRIGIRLPF